MVLRARFDPAPLAAALLALPEPGVALEVVHREVDRLGSPRGGDARRPTTEHDRLARAHRADAVEHQNTHRAAEARERLVGERFHAPAASTARSATARAPRRRLSVRTSPTNVHTPPKPGWALVNGPTNWPRIERLGEQADVLGHPSAPR